MKNNKKIKKHTPSTSTTHAWLILIATGLGMGAAAFKWSALNALLPHIKTQLNMSLSELQWILNIYGLIGCSCMIAWGAVADRVGHQRIYSVGLVLFITGCLIAADASSATGIIVGQALTGLAAGIILPLSQTLITQCFSPETTRRALGRFATVVGLCIALGPSLGSSITHVGNWRWVFILVAVLQSIALVLIQLQPQSHSIQSRIIKRDVISAAWMMLTVFLLVLALDRLHHAPQPTVIRLIVLSIIAALFFRRSEQQSHQPIINPALFRHRAYRLAAGLNSCFFICLWPMLFITPLYLHQVLHTSPLFTAGVMLCMTLPVAILPPLCLRLLGNSNTQLNAKKQVITGFTLLLCSLSTAWNWHANTAHYWVLCSSSLFGLAWGLIWSPLNYLGVTSLPNEHAGTNVGSFVTLQELGGTLGIAVVISFARSFSSLSMGLHNGIGLLWIIAACGLSVAFTLGHHSSYAAHKAP